MILHLSPDSPVVLPSLKVSVRPLTRWIVDQMYCAVALKRLWPGLRLCGRSCVFQVVVVCVWGGNGNNAETTVDCIVANNAFLSWVIILSQFLLLLFRPLHVAHRMPEGLLHLREDRWVCTWEACYQMVESNDLGRSPPCFGSVCLSDRNKDGQLISTSSKTILTSGTWVYQLPNRPICQSQCFASTLWLQGTN